MTVTSLNSLNSVKQTILGYNRLAWSMKCCVQNQSCGFPHGWKILYYTGLSKSQVKYID
jgi:hypothetical protein